MRTVYLDHAAATPLNHKVLTAMMPYLTDLFYNPSAPYLPAVEVRHDYEQAKSVIAEALGAKASQLIMTAGATESINLAFSLANHVLISGVEHPAVYQAALARTSHRVIPVSSVGVLDVDKLSDLITDQIDFVSVSLASSDLGTIQPIAEVSRQLAEANLQRKLAGREPILFHCDASQALGYLEVNPSRLGVDLLTISAAKIGGPKQVGALWVRSGVKLKPLIRGGGQEMGIRSGTENVAGVVGFAAAVKQLTHGGYYEVAKVRDRLGGILLAIPGAKLLNHTKKRLPNYCVISFPGLEAERLIYRLEARGIYVSTGAACSANRGVGSLALRSINLSESEQLGSLRLTIGVGTSMGDVEYAGQIIVDEVKLEQERVRL